MTRDALLKRLQLLSDEEFAFVSPFLEANFEALPDLEALHAEIQAGRTSASTEPLRNAQDVYRAVREVLGE